MKLVKTAAEAKDAAATILSKPLVTPQTGPEGVPVNKLLIASGVDIEKEYYLGIVVDRAQGCPVLMGSAEGGMDIEEVAAKTPEKIIKEPIDPVAGLQAYQARKVAFAMGFKGKQVGQAIKVMGSLTKLFLGTDASLVEINPLIVTPASDEHPDGQVLAIDAKIDFDDNAMFRHKDIKALEDPAEVDPAEAKASEFGLSYINLDGNIGCLVNGAGLAMATMDIIKLHGGEPANFLDVGGSASEEAVTEAFRIILADDGVKGDPRQHLRRHRQMRHHRQRDRRRRQAGRLQRAAGRASRRHQRRARPGDPRERQGRHPHHDRGQRLDRRGPEDHRGHRGVTPTLCLFSPNPARFGRIFSAPRCGFSQAVRRGRVIFREPRITGREKPCAAARHFVLSSWA